MFENADAPARKTGRRVRDIEGGEARKAVAQSPTVKTRRAEGAGPRLWLCCQPPLRGQGLADKALVKRPLENPEKPAQVLPSAAAAISKQILHVWSITYRLL